MMGRTPLGLPFILAALAGTGCSAGAGGDPCRDACAADDAGDGGSDVVVEAEGVDDGIDGDGGACAPPRLVCLGVCVDPRTDGDNCGDCGIRCAPAHAAGACATGVCVAVCEAGWVDANGVPFDGCEYECSRTAGAETRGAPDCTNGLDDDCDGRTDAADPDCADCVPEFCNGTDDDCDGLTDETFDRDFDPLHCGACGHACPARTHAGPACVLGVCALACEPGWSDADGVAGNGCETGCVGSSAAEVACDGVDDDCDGATDESFAPASRCGLGLCERGEVCARGMVTCRPRTPPAATDATCDGVDDDCDGTTDDEADCSCAAASDCDDANPCTDDACGADLRCVVTAAADGTPCPGGACCARACAGPEVEACNGRDDNCNTACDETFECCRGASEPCTTGSGGAGTRACGADCSLGPCEGTGDPCNGADDNGDTRCDEGFECCAGAGERCTTGCGLDGSRACTGSCAWGGCEPPATAWRCPSSGAVHADRGTCESGCTGSADCSCSTSTEYFRVAGGFEGACECAPGDPPTCECESFCFAGSCPCGASSAVGAPPPGSYWIGDGCDSYLTGASYYQRDNVDCTCPLGSASCEGSPPRCTAGLSCDSVPGC
ncbi:MAG: hypothetical protein HY907_17140 [Deltaproteobacteria bacterium]|nr:hypothetical protein [Deltaproteobacteria bacterium]